MPRMPPPSTTHTQRIRPRGVKIGIPFVTEDEIADVGEHDGGLVVGDHVAGAEDVVVGEASLRGGWGVSFVCLGGGVRKGNGGSGGKERGKGRGRERGRNRGRAREGRGKGEGKKGRGRGCTYLEPEIPGIEIIDVEMVVRFRLEALVSVPAIPHTIRRARPEC